MTTDEIPDVNARRRRNTVIVAACAVVFVTAGAVLSTFGDNPKRDHLSIAGYDATSTALAKLSTTTTTTAIPNPSTPSTSPAVDQSRTSKPLTSPAAETVQPAQPGDLAGTIGLATTDLPVSPLDVHFIAVSLTIRNVSDHPISILNLEGVGRLEVMIDIPNEPGDLEALVSELPSLAPGEQHTFLSSFDVDCPCLIGPARAIARIYVPTSAPSDADPHPENLVGVPPVPVEIVPPGWTEGDPPDTTQGKWQVEMSADAAEIPEDGAVVVHATVRNVGNVPQSTTGFGLLAISCGLPPWSPYLIDHVVDKVTLAPGARAVFSFKIRPGDFQKISGTRAEDIAQIGCSVGMKFPRSNFGTYAMPFAGLQSDSVTIAVVHPPAANTTTTTTTLP
jgi:hypothetical protein